MVNNLRIRNRIQTVNKTVQIASFNDTVVVMAYLGAEGRLNGISKEAIANRYKLLIAKDPQKEILNTLIDSLKEYEDSATDEEFDNLNSMIQQTKREDLIFLIESLFDVYSLPGRTYRGHMDLMIRNSMTPDYINDLLVRLSDIKLKDHVLDPSVGVGGTLLEILKNNNEQYCVGQEIVNKTAAIAIILLKLVGAKNSKILSGDTLKNPQYVKNGQLEKFDVVVSNPPLGLNLGDGSFAKEDKYNRFSFGVPRGRADWGFIMNAVSSTNENGRSVLVVSTGATFRGGIEENIRRELLKDDFFEAVISFPRWAIGDRVSLPVSILFFNKNKAANKRNKVLFINVHERELFQTHRLSKLVDKIIEVERDFKSIDGYSQVVNVSDINPATMEAAHYVPDSHYHVDRSPYVVNLKDFVKGDNQKLEDVATIDRGYNLSPRLEDPKGKYQIVKISDVNQGAINYDGLVRGNVNSGSKVENYEIAENDILLSIRGAVNKVAIAKNVQPNILVNSNMVRIRTNKKMDPDFLKLFIESPVGVAELDSLSMGMTIKQIKMESLKNYLIPKLSLEEQRTAVEAYEKKKKSLDEKYQQLIQDHDFNLETLYKKMNLAKYYEKVEKNDED